MKPNVPVTYFIDWRNISNELVPSAMEVVAATGIKNIVLTDAIMHRAGELDVHEIFLKSAAAAGLTYIDAHAPLGETE